MFSSRTWYWLFSEQQTGTCCCLAFVVLFTWTSLCVVVYLYYSLCVVVYLNQLVCCCLLGSAVVVYFMYFELCE